MDSNNLYKTKFQRISSWWAWLTADPISVKYNLNHVSFVKRQYHADTERTLQRSMELKDRFYGPISFSDVLNDNLWRFTILGFLDRLSIVKQTSPYAPVANLAPKEALLAGLGRQTLFTRGLFRGNLLSFLQFTGVHFQALAFSGKDASSFFTSLLIFDTLLHPLDTIRTRWTADIRGNYPGLADVARRTPITQLFNGLIFKLAYTFLLGSYLLNLNNENHLSISSLGLLAAAYPLLTLKSVAQVANTNSSLLQDLPTISNTLGTSSGLGLVKRLYRGFLPFFVLNTLAPYTFPQLWGEHKRHSSLEHAREGYLEKAEIMKGNF